MCAKRLVIVALRGLSRISQNDTLKMEYLSLFENRYTTIVLKKSTMASQGAYTRRPRLQTTVIGTPRCGVSASYENCYLKLRSQRTIIESLLTKSTEEIQEHDLTIQEQFQSLISRLLGARYLNLFAEADECVIAARSLVERKSMSPQIEKLFNTFTSAAFAINKIANELGVITMFGDDQNTAVEHEYEKMRVECEDSEDVLVCRICENKVPAKLFKEHTDSCLQSCKSESAINRTNESIKELIKKLEHDFMDEEWPGERKQAVVRTVPALHLLVLLHRALELDPHISDTIDELVFIMTVLKGFEAPHLILSVDRAVVMIREKIISSCALNDAKMVLRLTGVDDSESRAGQVAITDFRFIKEISQGAFATVFLAEKISTGDIFAIKATEKRTLKQKNQVRRILAEKDILLQFSNPYIVKFYYSIIGQKNLYLVTEFVPGGDLFSLLTHVGALDEDAAKIYAMEVLLALKYLRQNGIIHRDIKPDNILVTANGRLKLTDFGLSYVGVVDRSLGTDENTCDRDLKVAASLVGTPDYIAPEILRNQPHSFTVDYWSLGVMIYEFVTGVPPFHGETQADVERNILLGEISFTEEMSDEFVDLIRKLLNANPAQRLGAGSIDEIINHPWFDGVDPEACEPPFIPQLESDVDTCYFQQRYEFDETRDSSILCDFKEREADRRYSGDGFAQDGSVGDDDISSFSGISVDQLGNANFEAAQRLQEKLVDSEMKARDGVRVSSSLGTLPPVLCKRRKSRRQSFIKSRTKSSDASNSKIIPDMEMES